jgi:hypothetical protein
MSVLCSSAFCRQRSTQRLQGGGSLRPSSVTGWRSARPPAREAIIYVIEFTLIARTFAPSQLRVQNSDPELRLHSLNTDNNRMYPAAWSNRGEYEGMNKIKPRIDKKTRTGESKITERGCVVVVSLGVADHVHGRGGAWPHINKKRGIVRIDGGIFR